MERVQFRKVLHEIEVFMMSDKDVWLCTSYNGEIQEYLDYTNVDDENEYDKPKEIMVKLKIGFDEQYDLVIAAERV